MREEVTLSTDSATEETPRCLCLSSKTTTPSTSSDDSGFPHQVERLPPAVTCLTECATQQIQDLLNKEQEGTSSLSPEEEDAIDDGFFLCDLNVVRNKLAVWHQLFPRIHPFFAIKCNPDPMVAAVLGRAGAGFDCASIPEIRLALESSTTRTQREKEDSSKHDSVVSDNRRLKESARKIVYANPQRAEQDLDQAFQLQVQAFTFDGPEELYKVHRAYEKARKDDTTAPQRAPPSMILRILVPDEHSTVPLGEKFGAALAHVPSLVELAMQLTLPIVGVSFHCGSGNHDPTSYHTAIEMATEAMSIIDEIQTTKGLESCWLLDIGGGYPGLDGKGGDTGRFSGEMVASTGENNTCSAASEDNEETAAKVASVVSPLLDRLYQDDHVQFIAEPGRYFAEAAFCLCSRIYRLRVDKDGHRHYSIAQGVQGVFKDCVLCGETFVPIPLKLERKANDEETVPSTVHGPSGEDYDVICRDYPLPILNVGDWLLFDRMGAYTLSIAARNGRPPVRYVMGATQVK